MPCRITRSSSSGSTLPPDSTATTGGSNAVGLGEQSGDTAAAPAGSTTSLARSSSSTSARDEPVLADRDDVVDERLDQRERHVARTGDGDPVGHRRHGRSSGTGLPAASDRG